MNMKKPLALLLAAGMTLGLAACGNGSQGNSESPAPGGETGGSSSGAVELNLWSFNVGGFAEASNWEPIIAAFNEQNPDIKITVTPINYQDGDQKLTSAITAGTGPDIIFEGPERIVGNYAREGLMVDLSDLWETGGSDIAEGISSVSQLDGTYYMYPLSVAAHCMAINYEAFEAAGALQYIDEETRTWTTDNFVKAMEACVTPLRRVPSTSILRALSTVAPRAVTKVPAPSSTTCIPTTLSMRTGPPTPPTARTTSRLSSCCRIW